MAQAVGHTSTSLTRRALLGKAVVAAPMIAVATAGAAGAMTVERHPDAALLAAWEGYVAAHRAFDHAVEVLLPGGGTNTDHEPYYEAIDFYETQIEQHQASSIEGFAVQLRYLFAKKMESAASYRSAIYGEPVNQELSATLAADWRDRMLWDMTQAAMRASRA